jgi:type II secretory pathway pseudopilin PulG
LIVVAIIAILAAIAVPNFLEAQTRSKVSRVQADFRTLATAIESYMVDTNGYPIDQDDQLTSPNEFGFRQLTTPISYFTSGFSLRDPFADPRRIGQNDAIHYQMASGVDPARRSPSRTPITDPLYQPIQAWALFSNGPSYQGGEFEAVMGNDDWPFRPVNADPLPAHTRGIQALYDPSNGTLSFGGVFRFGGDYNNGNWTVTDIPHEQWGIKATYP